MKVLHSRRVARARRGMALMVVLLVLLALLVLCAPFLASARDADRASSQQADRVEARLALDAASRHARHVLGATYASADLDRTPWFDESGEVQVDNRFAQGFLDPNDPKGAMWDLEVRDTSGAIDLDSASPHVVANLLGLVGRSGAIIESDAKAIGFSGGANFAPTGFVAIDGEIVRYGAIEDGALTGLARGVLGPAEGEDWQGGPRPSSGHGVGVNIVDQRAFALAAWRLREKGALLAPDAPEQLGDVGRFAMAAAIDPRGAGVVGEAMLEALRRHGAVHGEARGVATWQRAVRVTTPIEAGRTGRLRVADSRFVNAGSTVRIGDGALQELALVQQVARNGELVLDRILEGSFPANGAVLEVLARRPVNANSADERVLEALFLNLQLVGRNSRVTSDEARALASLTIESRPFTGHEDWMRRVLLPAAGLEKLPADAPLVPDALASGAGFLDALDAMAVHANVLNSNDASLAWSTMPLSFVSRDIYDFELRASANAPSGIARAIAVREETVVVAPQQELVRLWARQEDFDEELRLALQGPLWATGPRATSRHDNHTATPSRFWPNWGVKDGSLLVPGTPALPEATEMVGAERVFPARDEESWLQLQPTREWDVGRRAGRILHFDQESRDLEGRWLPDQPVKLSSSDAVVGWTTSASPLARPIAWSGWIRPRSIGDGSVVDFAGTETAVERVQLLFEGADLVLRVLDGFGDHRDTSWREAAELRYSLAGGGSGATAGPGLPADTWHHVHFEVRGNRPSQMSMLVNGQALGVRTPGLTRLSRSLSQGDGVLVVDSLEGFPAQCVVRIGNELVEVVNDGVSLKAERQLTGPLAGFGGRLAREPWAALVEGGTANVPINFANLTTAHPAGAPVELHGYALPNLSDVPAGRAQLAQELGRFRVSQVDAVVGASSPLGDPIVVPVGPAAGLTLGNGLASNSSATGLVLRCADDGDDTQSETPAAEYMAAFNPGGGYAAIVQVGASLQTGQAQDNTGAAIGGIEIIRYSGWSDRTLRIAQRGVAANTLPNLGAVQGALIGGLRSFVVDWSPNIYIGGGAGQPAVQVLTRLAWRCYVLPISIPVPGASTAAGFLAADLQNPRLAQFTRPTEAEYTEWVRYDYFDAANGQLVRDEPAALERVYRVIVGGGEIEIQVPPTGGGGGGGPGGGPSGAVGALAGFVKETGQTGPDAAKQSGSTAGAQSGGAQWDPRLGTQENTIEDHPISRAVESHYRFRGVLGTSSHLQPAGTLVLPVIAMPDAGPDGGRPGRRDTVFLSGPTPDHPGWPLVVHRAHIPAPLVGTTAWEQVEGVLRPQGLANQAGGPVPEDVQLLNRCWLAFEDRSPEPFLGLATSQGQGGQQGASPANGESRLLTRIACFPSGERPRLVSGYAVGGGANGLPGTVPSAIVDEIIHGDHQFGRATPNVDPEAAAGASLVLAQEITADASTILVAPTAARLALGVFGGTHEFLSDLPVDGGLLRIGDEIIGYSQLDAASGTITVATNGRGMLGTDPGPHQPTEPVAVLEHFVVSTLSAGVGAGDATFSLLSADDFPPEGLVRIDDELVHYTRVAGAALEMPRTSLQPGLRDERGSGLFRGRHGTQAAAHDAGTLVVLHPCRYPDRWADGADAPEMAYFSFAQEHPAAWWTGVFFASSEADGVRLRALQKTRPEAPWDADPEEDARLRLLERGDKDGGAIPIMVQSDRVEWRVHAVYDQRAFDAVAGLSHGWKRTPKLRMHSVFYYAPSTTLRRIDR